MKSKLEMIIHPNILLSTKCELVEKIDSVVITQCQDMVGFLKETSGVGLAANQVGFSNRVIITKLSGAGIVEMVNPEILSESGEQYEVEGCLSIPKYFVRIKRANKIEMEYLDLSGEMKQKTLYGLDAVIIQHEIDHLNGILFVDRLAKIHRSTFLKKYKQILKKERKNGKGRI